MEKIEKLKWYYGQHIQDIKFDMKTDTKINIMVHQLHIMKFYMLE